jgi:hypothetical protein
MYGSVQLDSLIKAGFDRQYRLKYFNSVIGELLRGSNIDYSEDEEEKSANGKSCEVPHCSDDDATPDPDEEKIILNEVEKEGEDDMQE